MSTLGQVLLSSAIVVCNKSAVTSACTVVLILLLLSRAGTVAFPCTSGVWLTIDTFSARASGSTGPWPTQIRSNAAWMTASVGSITVARHCCNYEARMRASEFMAAGS